MLIFIYVYEVEVCKLMLCCKTREPTPEQKKEFLLLKSILFYLYVLTTGFLKIILFFKKFGVGVVLF